MPGRVVYLLDFSPSARESVFALADRLPRDGIYVAFAERAARLPSPTARRLDLGERTDLKAAFQEENARLAAAALRLLGFPEEAIAQGLREARHPGRLERFLLEGVEVYLDGAHNPPAALALSRELSAYHLVFGAFPRKDVKGVLAHLLPKARSVRYTRAGEGALGRELGEPFFEDPWEALGEAVKAAQGDGVPVLATGSLYLVGALRGRLLPRFG